MRLSRRASWLLIAFAIWSWIIWVTLVKNIAADPRAFHDHKPTGFFDIHFVLAIISLTMGSAIGWLGWKGLKGAKPAERTGAAQEAAAAATTPQPEKV